MKTDNFSSKAMNETLTLLEERIIDFLKTSNMKTLMKQFSEIDSPTIFAGSGGSSVVVKFIANIISEKNGCICEGKIVDEVLHTNLRPYRNVIFTTYSSKNYGITCAEQYIGKNYSHVNVSKLTSDKTLDKNTNMVYEHTIPSEDSFISFANTFAPMAVALAYYIGDVDKTIEVIKDMFEKIKQSKITPQACDVLEIIGKEKYPGACAFVESALSESSIATPVISATYDELHGRTTSMINQPNRHVVLLTDTETEVHSFLHERLNQEQITDINADYDDIIINDFFLSLQMSYYVAGLAELKGIDLSSMTNRNGERIHLTADQDAIETWQQENQKSFWDRPNFSALNKKGSEQKPAGFYAPTGKYAEVKPNSGIKPSEYK